jgi:hypothetical protein
MQIYLVQKENGFGGYETLKCYSDTKLAKHYVKMQVANEMKNWPWNLNFTQREALKKTIKSKFRIQPMSLK